MSARQPLIAIFRSFVLLAALQFLVAGPLLASGKEEPVDEASRPIAVLKEIVLIPFHSLVDVLHPDQSPDLLAATVDPLEGNGVEGSEQEASIPEAADPLEERSSVWLDEDSKVCLNYEQGNLMVMLKSHF